jgi:ABC-type multidrug transport system permease subunit
MVGLFTEMHANGYLIAQIFFGLWLWPLGVLVLRSGWFPRALGWLLIVGAGCYLVETLLLFALPDLSSTWEGILVLPAAVAELWMVVWLLIKAVPSDEPTPLERATT